MEFYLFKPTPSDFSADFKLYYGQQNLKVVRVSAGIVFTLSSVLAFLNLAFGFKQLEFSNNFFITSNAALAVATGLTFAASFFPKPTWQPASTITFIQSCCFFFGVSYTLGCLAVCIAQENNPKNTPTLFLLGLTVVALLFVFEYWQHLIYAVLIELIFVVSLFFLNLSTSDLLLNLIISVFLITFFFVAARLNYSFRASFFIQLKEIELKNAEIQRISQAKTDILGVVAHDLLSPFANIESLIRLSRKQKLTPERQAEYFDWVLDQCHSSRDLINDLLETARYENEKDFPTQPTDLNQFLTEVHAKWQTQLKGNRQLKWEQPSQPVFVNLNKEGFDRVINNLISNAVKFTNPDGFIKLELQQQAGQIELNISDNGIGIPSDLQPYLFERFSKARRRGLRGETSTGLGLSITQHLIQRHGGTIKVKSTENQGTAFQIILPGCATETSA